MSRRRREVLIAAEAPEAVGPYSLAIRAGELIFAAGSLGIDPASGELVEGGIQAQTRQALTNLQSVLKSGGSDLALVVKTTVFLQDINDFGAMNEVYAEFFHQDPPARSAVQAAALPKGGAVEIEAIAVTADPRGD